MLLYMSNIQCLTIFKDLKLLLFIFIIKLLNKNLLLAITIKCYFLSRNCNCVNNNYSTVWTLSTLTSQNKNGGISVGTFVNFVWMTIGENFLTIISR